MNSNYKLIKISLVFILLVFVNSTAMAQPPCEECPYGNALEKHGDKPDDDFEMSQSESDIWYYQGCDEEDNERVISFIHGLGGDFTSWKHPIAYTFELGTSVGIAEYNSGPYEDGFLYVGKKLAKDLVDDKELVDQVYTDRCPDDDYVIAHSQGGIAARYLDQQWNLGNNGTFGKRTFRGLVTFGTPHAGADISRTRHLHTEYVSKVIRTFYLKDLEDEIYNLDFMIGSFFNGVSLMDVVSGPIDTLIKHQLTPLMLASVHAPTLDQMHPESDFMSDLNTYESSLHRVAFYGIEQAPECWRAMDNMVHRNAEDYERWGAVRDIGLRDTMEDIRANHKLRVAMNIYVLQQYLNDTRGHLYSLPAKDYDYIFKKTYGGVLEAMTKENVARNKSIRFLNNANTEWRYLIGAYDRDNYIYEKDTQYHLKCDVQYEPNGPWEHLERVFDKYIHAVNYYNTTPFHAKANHQIYYKVTTHKKYTYRENDGVVLKQSALAFPGVKSSDTDKMEGDNHFQMRNSPETQTVLDRLYDGVKYDPYFLLK